MQRREREPEKMMGIATDMPNASRPNEMGRAAVGGVPLLPPHPSTPTEATFIMAPKLNPEYTKMLKTPARSVTLRPH